MMRVVIAGLLAGVVMNLSDFVMHGLIMGPTYVKYAEVFSQEPANPAWFALIAVCISLVAAFLFAKTRASWAPGVKGGVVFGIFIGMLGFFPQFYSSLVIDGFPYHLSWCWGGIVVIDSVLAGIVFGVIIRRE